MKLIKSFKPEHYKDYTVVIEDVPPRGGGRPSFMLIVSVPNGNTFSLQIGMHPKPDRNQALFLFYSQPEAWAIDVEVIEVEEKKSLCPPK